MVLFHGAALERLPSTGVAEGLHATSDGINQCLGREVAEAEAGCPLQGLIRVLNRILESTGGANHREGAVPHRIHLIQPARFVP